MPSSSARSRNRNVFISDLRRPERVLAGLVLTNGVTHENLYQMIDVVLLVQGRYFIQDEDGETINRDANPLTPGYYLLVADGPVLISNKMVLQRAMSADGTRTHAFRDAVRRRDGGCVVTGLRNVPPWEEWLLWDCAHIFPLAHEQVWKTNNYRCWVNIVPENGESINSVQNGLCLSKHAHALFDAYYFSINPDDNFKIICFQRDFLGIGGRRLDPGLVQDPRGPSVHILRWHFRHAVLANMRGVGEPVHETDFPPGSDMVGEILSGPKPAERMEFELFSRLRSDE